MKGKRMKGQFNIFGDIVENDGERWFESDITPAILIGWLAKQEGDIEININSNGGSVTAGLAIANAIKAYSKGEVTCNVLGIAASMASVIACAGKRLCMGEGAFLMVHNPWTVTMGNAEDLRKDADTLDKMRDSILGFYQSKCPGKTADDLKAIMDAETWLNPADAAAFGFAVESYAGELKAAASLTRRAFAKAPEAARAFFEKRESAQTAKGEAKADDSTPTSQSEGTAKAELDAPAAAENAATGTPETPAPSKEAQAQEAKEEVCEPVASEAKSITNATAAQAENWEARFKGLSAKYNDLQRRAVADIAAAEKRFNDALAAKDAEILDFKTQLDKSAKDLADANAKVSELGAQVEEAKAALQTANEDLATTRDSLRKAEDKAAELEKTRDLLTAGVLTPPCASSYADKMKAAKTPEEREALRAQKRSGKIK